MLSSAFFFLYRSFCLLRGKSPFQFCLFSALVGENFFFMLCVHSSLVHTPRSMLGRQSDVVKRALRWLRSWESAVDTVLGTSSSLIFTRHSVSLCPVRVLSLPSVHLVSSNTAPDPNFHLTDLELNCDKGYKS